MQNEYQGEIVQLADPMNRDFSGFESLPMQSMGGGEAVPFGGASVIVSGPREITAKKVAVPRSMGQILQNLRTYCASFGDTYVYSWEVNDKRNRRKTTIEGGTIKLANDLVQLYGNCSVDLDINETKTHLIFKAFFIDYERGTCVSRMFQQRKSQDTGMSDTERQADIVFQIGQSKAIRNVVLNALASLSNFAIEESKRGMVAKFGEAEGRDRALAFIEKVRERADIDIRRIEAVVGRRLKDWTARDLARVWSECRAIVDGMASPDDVYPSLTDATDIIEEKQKAADEGRKRPATAKKAEAKTEPAPSQGERAESKPGPAAGPATKDKAAELGDIPSFLDRRTTKPAAEDKPAPGSGDDQEPPSDDDGMSALDGLTAALTSCETIAALDAFLEEAEGAIAAMPRDDRTTFETRVENWRKSLAKADETPADDGSAEDFFNA